jgi:hypothetical protein
MVSPLALGQGDDFIMEPQSNAFSGFNVGGGKWASNLLSQMSSLFGLTLGQSFVGLSAFRIGGRAFSFQACSSSSVQ